MDFRKFPGCQLVIQGFSKDTSDLLAIYQLIKICQNVVRGHRLKNSRLLRFELDVLGDLLLRPGILESLFEIGFEEDPSSNEHLMFPISASVAAVKNLTTALYSTLLVSTLGKEISLPDAVSSNKQPPLTENSTAFNSTIRNRISCTTQPSQRTHVSKDTLQDFRQSLMSNFKAVRLYEDPVLQQRIRTVVPHERLQKTAEEMCHMDNSSSGATDSALRDVFLFLLLRWFKEEFFHWVDTLDCETCRSKTTHLPHNQQTASHFQPTAEERRFGAGRVELFLCPNCRLITRFPRYNDPAKLLETRRGRCGEWANCFTAICRAMGFDARHVHDNADHVWTEVYSEQEQRWLHCDSCETALDKPLLYEAGWGKKLSYVFAVSHEEIVDVSWRYSADHDSLMTRRNKADERALRRLISSMNRKIQSGLSVTRKEILRKRTARELIDLLTVRNASDAEQIGRTSGSLLWRVSRGELGTSNGQPESEGIMISPTEENLQRGQIELTYNAATDVYQLGQQTIHGYGKLAYDMKNILRKVETDWRMAYLARNPGTQSGEISWKIETTSSERAIRRLEVTFPRETFQSGEVKLTMILNGNDGSPVELGQTECFSKDFGGGERIRSVIIRAVLRGGSGENAWQHAQLFRTSLDGQQKIFSLKVFLMPVSQPC